MPPRSLSLALIGAAAVVTQGGSSSARLLIGDIVRAEPENLLRFSAATSSTTTSHSTNSNEEILKSMLSKETFNLQRDECLHSVINGTSTYTTCDIRRFPYCSGDTPDICFNRINRQDAFWPDKHPKYYIDYDRVRCYPKLEKSTGAAFACSSCSPGRWCEPEGRCILDETKYSCWAGEVNS